MSVTIVPQAGKYDLARDILLWLVQDATTAGGDPNFVDGDNSTEDQQSGKITLFATYADDLPNDAGVVTSNSDQKLFQFAPVRSADCSILIRMADKASEGSGQIRAQAAAKAIAEFLETSKLQTKTHITLPSTREVLIAQDVKVFPAGLDESRRYQIIIEFVMNYLDEVTQA